MTNSSIPRRCLRTAAVFVVVLAVSLITSNLHHTGFSALTARTNNTAIPESLKQQGTSANTRCPPTSKAVSASGNTTCPPTSKAASPVSANVSDVRHSSKGKSNNVGVTQTQSNPDTVLKNGDDGRQQQQQQLGGADTAGKKPSSTFSSTTAPQKQNVPHPQRRYLLFNFRGRLGNVLFQLSSTLCIALLNNLTLIVPDVEGIRNLQYSGRRVPLASWSGLSMSIPDVVHHSLTLGGTFDPSFMALEPRDCSHSLSGHFQSWRYFQPCQAEVRRATRFKDHVVTEAVQIVTDLRKRLPRRTLVGVHVRRGDYLLPRQVEMGRRVAPPDYFLRAMTYFRRFRDVTFVVLSQDPDWFWAQVTSSAGDVIMLKMSASPEVDMEVLSRMDHLIMSVGTYGWWSAYKNFNGTVVYFKDFYAPGSTVAEKFQNVTEYFIPEWIPM
ncbi:galactoside alpha-(1,2)-fucosyltransferase 1-like [Babylonia areolata]|uniref:galactoside alpha-(1,2)-fucosyltransferase 1-like n=1 Tax=Babylonia areolata TaxID=304850 RepID=UPI003FD29DDC